MSGPLSGPGLGLQLPQYLYPTELTSSPIDAQSNKIGLAAGQQLPIPRGDWIVDTGSYCILEYLDPVSGIWISSPAAAWTGGPLCVSSDGFSVRVANRTGCPMGYGIINAYGSSYVQASTSISVTGGGGSTWQPIVGGQLSLLSVTSAGAGYGVAPIVLISAPPPAANNANGVGGVPATGYAVIASGTVSGFTFTNPGAGYQTAPTAVVLPNPTDPNISSGITAATITFTIVGGGSLTAALCTNPGAPLSTPNNITLTVAGAGTNATVSAVMMQTITAASVTAGGAGYGTVSALLTTVGGYPTSAGPATPAIGTVTAGPNALYLAARPRPAQFVLAVTGAPTLGSIAAQVGTGYDSGLFYGVPTPILGAPGNSGTVGSVIGPTLALTMGSRPDFITLQPLKA
jgi:hypothetical protein